RRLHLCSPAWWRRHYWPMKPRSRCRALRVAVVPRRLTLRQPDRPRHPEEATHRRRLVAISRIGIHRPAAVAGPTHPIPTRTPAVAPAIVRPTIPAIVRPTRRQQILLLRRETIRAGRATAPATILEITRATTQAIILGIG